MKILEITFIPPSKMTGGGLGIYQSIQSLAGVAEVDYIGPLYEESLFEKTEYSVHPLFILNESDYSIKSVIHFILEQISTSFYDDWMNIVNKIPWQNYKFVHIESSRYMFAVKAAKKRNKIVLIRMHNIECDYGHSIFAKSRSIKNWIRYMSFRFNEKKVIKYADSLIFLTNMDQQRIKDLYNRIPKHFYQIPVCIDSSDTITTVKKRENDIHILITGSLNHKANKDGIIWFLKNVWKKLTNSNKMKSLYLTIAGAHPDDKFVTFCQAFPNTVVIDTPIDMKKYFENADLYVAVVFHGAGMKVKVAEALSYGLPVVGTSHCWIGYEKIIHGKYIADSPKEFLDAITKLINRNDFASDRLDVINDFKENLSIEFSKKAYRDIIHKLNEVDLRKKYYE